MATASVKLAPPRVPSWYVPRPDLERRLAEASGYRLTSVVAGAGYGKSTHVAFVARDQGWSWYTADESDRAPATLARGLAAALAQQLGELALPVGGGDGEAVAEMHAAAIAGALDDAAAGELVLVVDDVHELGRDSAAGRLLEGLVRYSPPAFHLVLCSRDEPPFLVSRLRGQGQVVDIGAADLAFTTAEVRAFVGARIQTGADEIAGPLHMVSGGWPAAVQLATDVLRSAGDEARALVLESLAARRGPMFSYLADEVFARESPEVRELFAVLAELGSAPAELLEALGCSGAEETLAALARRGLVVPPPPSSGSYTLHGLVREFVQASWGMTPARSRDLRRRAAAWFETEGAPAEALQAAVTAGDGAAVARLLRLHARELNELGLTDLVIRASAVVPPDLRLRTSTGAVSHAYILQGEVERGEEWLALFEQRLREDPAIASEIAVQRAIMHIGRGDSAGALAALERAGPEPGGFIEAFMVYQLLTLGREDEAVLMAGRALGHTEAEPSSTPYAEALMASGEVDRVVRGDSAAAEERFRTAADIAEGLGNMLASCSARRRIAFTQAERGQLASALATMSETLEQADRTGVFEFMGSTRAGRGVVHFGLGRLDEAEADFLSSIEVYERLGSTWMAAPLIGLGDVHRERGEPAQARSAYERALALSERGGQVAHESAAASGLACLLVDDEPEQAEALLERARAKSTPRQAVLLALAEGWISIAFGDRERARRMAELAGKESTRRGLPAVVAQALELRCFAAAEPRFATDPLREALGIWRRIGASAAAARTFLALASLGEDLPEPEVAAARRVLQEAGIRLPGIGAGVAAMIELDRPPPLQIETLGRFSVVRDGVPVPLPEWQSKKARDLLKLLITKRGKTAPRDFLVEALWPDEDPKKTSNRLSVALNVLRGVLDPRGSFDADRFVAGDREGIRLELGNVAVDLEAFLEQAEAGLRALAHEEPEAAQPVLEAAEATYRGEFLEEDAYEDWAIPLRDEARSTYLEVARALALAGPETTRYHLRILALDPYDEDTHLDLVSRLAASARHGEARRAYRRYVQRMGEIGVEPAGFPDRAARQGN